MVATTPFYTLSTPIVSDKSLIAKQPAQFYFLHNIFGKIQLVAFLMPHGFSHFYKN